MGPLTMSLVMHLYIIIIIIIIYLPKGYLQHTVYTEIFVIQMTPQRARCTNHYTKKLFEKR